MYNGMSFQLSALGNTTMVGGFPDLRWAQTAKYGYVPNQRLRNVFMAVAMDLPDFNSPFGLYVFLLATFQIHDK